MQRLVLKNNINHLLINLDVKYFRILMKLQLIIRILSIYTATMLHTVTIIIVNDLNISIN